MIAIATSSREAMRAAIRALGGSLWHSDSSSDFFTLANPNAFFGVRDSLPFSCLYCHEGDGGLVVNYDRPNSPVCAHCGR